MYTLEMGLATMSIVKIVGANLSDPHTSGTALQDACVCLSVCLLTYVWPYAKTLNWTNGYTKVHVHFKFAHVLKLVKIHVSVQVDTMEPSLSNSTPVDVLNVNTA